MAVHPACSGEIEQHSTVETAGRAKVDVLDRGIETKLGRSKATLKTAVLAFGHLPVHEQSEAILEAKTAIGCRLFALLGEAMGHAGEIEAVELVERWCREHGISFQR
jgi:hypothetical protein